MQKLFINYRREDSEIYVARISERLKDPIQGLIGWEIFRDIDSLGAGEFRRNIQKFLVTCDVVLVVIGPRWKTILDERDATVDVARDEIKIALNSDAMIIPVLVGGASMPEFPRDLSKLADLNAFSVRNDPDFDTDMGRLIHAISPSPANPVPVTPPKKKRGIVFTCQIVLTVAIVLFLGGLLGQQMFSDRSGTDTDDRNATRTALASTAVAAANTTQTAVFTPTTTVTATPTPQLTAAAATTTIPVVIPLNLTAQQLENGSFEGNAAQIRFTQGCESRPDGISVNWDVSRNASYAGSVVAIPPEVAAAVQSDMNLVLWAESESSSMRFEVGLRSADDKEHKEIVSIPADEISIPLNDFAQFEVDITHLTDLVITFDYFNGEDSRKGTICIGGFGFSSP